MKKINLKDLLYHIAGEKHRDLVLITLSWKHAVGGLLSKRSTIVSYEHNVLFVKTVDHVWRQEFINLKPQILKDLKTKTKLEIKNILFV